MTAKRTQAFQRNNERHYPTPQGRIDGKLYSPPIMDTFSKEWEDGYGDGYEGNPRATQPNKNLQFTYDDGYDIGVKEREQVNRDQSSNT